MFVACVSITCIRVFCFVVVSGVFLFRVILFSCCGRGFFGGVGLLNTFFVKLLDAYVVAAALLVGGRDQ